MTRVNRVTIAGGVTMLILVLVLVLAPGVAVDVAEAQASESAPAAAELVQLLQQGSLDSVATKHAGSENHFSAALLLGGVQLLVVSGEYAAPSLLEPTIADKNYRDVYVTLQGAVVADTKRFVSDFGADGLVREATGEGQAADTYEAAGARTMFNGDWDAQSMSEEDYDTRFVEADAEYAEILGALIAELR